MLCMGINDIEYKLYFEIATLQSIGKICAHWHSLLSFNFAKHV